MRFLAGILCFCGFVFFGFSVLFYVGKPILEEAILERQCYTGYLH